MRKVQRLSLERIPAGLGPSGFIDRPWLSFKEVDSPGRLNGAQSGARCVTPTQPRLKGRAPPAPRAKSADRTVEEVGSLRLFKGL